MVGDDLLDCKDDTSSLATNILKTKILFNSVIFDSAEDDPFMSLCLKNMFLITPMAKPKYMGIPFKYFLEDI